MSPLNIFIQLPFHLSACLCKLLLLTKKAAIGFKFGKSLVGSSYTQQINLRSFAL